MAARTLADAPRDANCLSQNLGRIAWHGRRPRSPPAAANYARRTRGTTAGFAEYRLIINVGAREDDGVGGDACVAPRCWHGSLSYESERATQASPHLPASSPAPTDEERDARKQYVLVIAGGGHNSEIRAPSRGKAGYYPRESRRNQAI